MYPPGHPYLQTSTERLMRRAEALLNSEPIMVFGIAHDQLVVDGAATDPRNNIFRELAERLHRHRLATLRLSRGIRADELDRFVTMLITEPAKNGRAGIVADAASLDHIQVQAIEYERIVLGDGEADEAGGGGGRRTDDLWVDLARLTADSSPGSHLSDEVEAAVVARSIDCGSAEAGYDRQILGQLTRMAEELADSATPGDAALQARLSKLLSSLRPGTLSRILAAGADDDERARFLMATSSALDVDTAMKVLESVAAASKQEVSHHLLRLLSKMGKVSTSAPHETRAAADAALRANVNRLLEDWRLEDPNPEMYTVALDTMAMATPGDGARVEACDPILIVQVALEANAPGPRTDQAVDDALHAGRVEEMLALLQGAPEGAQTEDIWRRVATPERLRQVLEQGKLLSESTAMLISRLGGGAVDPLLDLLAAADERAMRSATLKVLASIGAPASDRAVALLPTAPWYVQRNLLVLLGRIGSWPSELPTPPYLAHADPRVRREAIKLLIESPGRRDAGLTVGVMDGDETIRTLALTAALDGCPGHALTMVERIIADETCTSETHVLAIRVLARSGESEVVDTLVGLAMVRRFRFLPARIAPKSPKVLAALAGLACHWSADPRAAEVLTRARRHRDLEVREAANATA